MPVLRQQQRSAPREGNVDDRQQRAGLAADSHHRDHEEEREPGLTSSPAPPATLLQLAFLLPPGNMSGEPPWSQIHLEPPPLPEPYATRVPAMPSQRLLQHTARDPPDPSPPFVDEQLNNDMTPKEIVAYLNKHIVGQSDAKRAIAIAMRNRSATSPAGSPPAWL